MPASTRWGWKPTSTDLQGVYDKVKTALMLETDRPGVLRQAIQAVRKGGTLSIPGVYGGLLDKVPFGAAFGKGITMKMGQTNMHKYMKPLLERIEKGQIDPTTSFPTASRWTRRRRCTRSGATRRSRSPRS